MISAEERNDLAALSNIVWMNAGFGESYQCAEKLLAWIVSEGFVRPDPAKTCPVDICPLCYHRMDVCSNCSADSVALSPEAK